MHPSPSNLEACLKAHLEEAHTKEAHLEEAHTKEPHLEEPHTKEPRPEPHPKLRTLPARIG